jgi:hypothetical protein
MPIQSARPCADARRATNDIQLPGLPTAAAGHRPLLAHVHLRGLCPPALAPCICPRAQALHLVQRFACNRSPQSRYVAARSLRLMRVQASWHLNAVHRWPAMWGGRAHLGDCRGGTSSGQPAGKPAAPPGGGARGTPGLCPVQVPGAAPHPTVLPWAPCRHVAASR